MKSKSLLALVFCNIILLLLTACSPEDINFLQSMAEEWARAKNSHPMNSDGSINFQGAFNAGLNAAGLPGKDTDVTAVLDAKAAVESIHKADEAADNAQQALKSGDPKKAVNLLNDAVKDRPDDWWLLNQRGVANIEAGNPSAGSKDLEDASLRSISSQNPSLEVKSRMQEEQLLRESIARQKGVTSLARCDTYLALSKSYSALATMRGKLLFQAQDASYYTKLSDENRNAASQPGVTCR